MWKSGVDGSWIRKENCAEAFIASSVNNLVAEFTGLESDPSHFASTTPVKTILSPGFSAPDGPSSSAYLRHSGIKALDAALPSPVFSPSQK